MYRKMTSDAAFSCGEIVSLIERFLRIFPFHRQRYDAGTAEASASALDLTQLVVVEMYDIGDMNINFVWTLRAEMLRRVL